MKRKTISMLLACTMTLSLVACGSTSNGSASGTPNDVGGSSTTSNDPEFTLIVGSTIQDDSASGIALIEYFKPYVEENSNGRIRVDVQNNSVLGGDRELFEAL